MQQRVILLARRRARPIRPHTAKPLSPSFQSPFALPGWGVTGRSRGSVRLTSAKANLSERRREVDAEAEEDELQKFRKDKFHITYRRSVDNTLQVSGSLAWRIVAAMMRWSMSVASRAAESPACSSS